MSLGPEKIILILVVALIVFGPQRLPEIARQVGAMMRELRRMQDTVRDELEHVLHPDFDPANAGQTTESAAIGETDHAALPPGALSEPGSGDTNSGDYADEDVTDDGFSGPRSFS
ncbi:MAG TPA: twin-arginine translocase TatA/TatE family subunit [Acidimicrobiia bacterium]|jgi:Tat protein translocase TatB subunit|nr:twin-arginine translocase TatA/TatE family subunit [Acidimicrobiia bacterium]